MKCNDEYGYALYDLPFIAPVFGIAFGTSGNAC